MLNRCAIFAAILMLLLSRALHDRWTRRSSGGDEALSEGAARLERVPLNLGDWEGEAMSLDAADVEQARLAGYLWRRYTNLQTGGSVSILLLYGPSGPVCVHTPDTCYGGAGYALLGQPAKMALLPRNSEPANSSMGASTTKPAEFWSGHFIKTSSVLPERLHIRWSWYAQDKWEAPANPRAAFARFSGLYKLYVIREDSSKEDDFLAQLLPALEAALSRS